MLSLKLYKLFSEYIYYIIKKKEFKRKVTCYTTMSSQKQELATLVAKKKGLAV